MTLFARLGPMACSVASFFFEIRVPCGRVLLGTMGFPGFCTLTFVDACELPLATRTALCMKTEKSIVRAPSLRSKKLFAFECTLARRLLPLKTLLLCVFRPQREHLIYVFQTRFRQKKITSSLAGLLFIYACWKALKPFRDTLVVGRTAGVIPFRVLHANSI